MLDPHASTQRRLLVSKSLLLVVAVIAAYVASLRPDNILFLVSLAFSFAAATFFPALTMGVFWKRANKWGAVAGMVAGLGITFYYAYITHPFFGGSMASAWMDINPISSGIWGIPLGFVVLIVVSLLTSAPEKEVQELVEHVRYPSLSGDLDTSGR